jgi:exopolysaccharide biosynthesis polyprenyl glycosylphosphotransferase
MAKQISLRFTLLLLFSDLALTQLALLLATQARVHVPLGHELGGRPGWAIPAPVYVATLVIWAVTFVAFNVYNPRQIATLSRELMRVVEATLFAWAALAGVLYFSYRDISRLQILYFLGFCVLLVITQRVIVRLGFWSRGGHRHHVRRVLIVGTGEIASTLAGLVRAHAWMGLSLEGFVGKPNGPNSEPWLGPVDDTLTIVERRGISEVVIALPRDDFSSTRELIYQLQALPVNIRLIPDYFDLVFLRLDFENFSGMPVLSLKEPVLDPFQRLVKRAFDLVVTLLVLVPVLPLMGLIALAIRLDSPGPALFRQQRVREGGALFNMLKFRTMCQNAEQLQAQVNGVDGEGHLIHKREDDPRVTRVGRILRRTSLDELPQLFNVLRGEMSLVGPRPELPWLVELYKPWQRKRFEVPQGLTGWWQVNGRSDKPMHLNTEDDLYYIRNCSLLFDLRIILLTIRAVVSGGGAY